MDSGEKQAQPHKRCLNEEDAVTLSEVGTLHCKRRAVNKLSTVASSSSGSSPNFKVQTRDIDAVEDGVATIPRVESSMPAPPQRKRKRALEEAPKDSNDSAGGEMRPPVKVTFLSGDSIDVTGLKFTDRVRNLRLLLQELRPGVRYLLAAGTRLFKDAEPLGDITHVEAFAQRGVFWEDCDPRVDISQTGTIAMHNVRRPTRPSDNVSIDRMYACAVAEQLPPGASASWEISIHALPHPQRYLLTGVLAAQAPLAFTSYLDLLQQAVAYDGCTRMWQARLGVCGRIDANGPQLREGDVLSFNLQKGMLTLSVGTWKRQAVGLAGLPLRPFVGFTPGCHDGELQVQIRTQMNDETDAA